MSQRNREIKFGALLDRLTGDPRIGSSAWLATGIPIQTFLIRRLTTLFRSLRAQVLVRWIPTSAPQTPPLRRHDQRPNVLPLRNIGEKSPPHPLPPWRPHQGSSARNRPAPRTADRHQGRKHGHLLRRRETEILKLHLYVPGFSWSLSALISRP